MVWGCTSDAGKSFLCTALCRWFSDKGLRVAPYKAQNMSNNARVALGGEMGAAQWFQAKAARIEPEVRHNPILLKPERDTSSQVVVMGQVDRELSSMPWRERSSLLWERARPSLLDLMSENDIVVIEGAGSPAEINLAASDYANLETARASGARCILVSDIDRGGSFAHLFGTWSLLPRDLRSALAGFVLNKFRGDASLLEPGPSELLSRTGVPLLGVLPRIAHGLPDEDAVALEHAGTSPSRGGVQVGVVAWPRISNFDEFRRMESWPGVSLRLVRDPSHATGLDLLILPGSKHVPSDLAWLRERGLDRTVAQHAASGRPVLGICGGFQALGGSIRDPFGVEDGAEGLGILPAATLHREAKIVRRLPLRLPELDGFWSNLSGREICGYEIRTGTVDGADPDSVEGRVVPVGNVLGVYLHGVLEDPDVLARLFGGASDAPDPLEETFDRLARLVDENLDMDRIMELTKTDNPRPRLKSSNRLAVLTGGARSGKSTAAQGLARSWGGDSVTYIATARDLDIEMSDRIRAHRLDRPFAWETIEEPMHPGDALRRASNRVVLLDCVGMFLTNHLMDGEIDSFRAALDDLLDAWTETGKELVVVTNETGMGIVPGDRLSRDFRDQLGWANQRLVAASTEARLLVAGVPLALKAS